MFSKNLNKYVGVIRSYPLTIRNLFGIRKNIVKFSSTSKQIKTGYWECNDRELNCSIISDIYRKNKYKNEYKHMLRSAMIAENNNEPDYIILSCLLSNIGDILPVDMLNKIKKKSEEENILFDFYLDNIPLSCNIRHKYIISYMFLKDMKIDTKILNIIKNQYILKYYIKDINIEELSSDFCIKSFNDLIKVRYYITSCSNINLEENTDIFKYNTILYKYISNI